MSTIVTNSVSAVTLGLGLGNGEFTFDFAKYNANNADAAIAALKSSGNTALTTAHELLIFAIRHYVQHGDYTKIPALIEAIHDGLGKAKHAEAVFYLKKNVPSLTITPSTNKRGNVTGYTITHEKGATRSFARDGNDAEGVSLVLMPFWKESDDETKTVTFNFNEELQKLIAKARKLEKKRDSDKAEGKTDTIYKINTFGIEKVLGLADLIKKEKVSEIVDANNARPAIAQAA